MMPALLVPSLMLALTLAFTAYALAVVRRLWGPE